MEIKELTSLSTSSYQNELFGSFMKTVIQTIENHGVAALGLTASRVTELKAMRERFTEFTVEARASEYTAKMRVLEADRQKRVSFILAQLRASAFNTEDQNVIAASELCIVTASSYVEMRNRGYKERTQVIDGLLIDLRKLNEDAARAMGLTPALINALQQKNDAFGQAYIARNAQRIAATEKAETVRRAMEPVWRSILIELTDRANAIIDTSLTGEAKEAAEDRLQAARVLVDELNSIIDDHRSRAKVVASNHSRPGKNGTEGTDDLDDENTEAGAVSQTETADGTSSQSGSHPTGVTEVTEVTGSDEDGDTSRTVTTVTTTTNTRTTKDA